MNKCTPEENAASLELMAQYFPTATSGNLTPTPREIPDYERAKVDCLAYIAELGITAEIKPNGVAETPAEGKDGKPWLHFRWACFASRVSPSKLILVQLNDYKTGIGNSTFKPLISYIEPCGGSFAVRDCAQKGTISRLKDPQTRLDACRYLKPKAPDIADILGSYARDYIDANRAGSFEDWAGDLGYDIDSRKAEQVYRECLAQRKPLMQLGLSLAEIEKIADYVSQF